MGVLFFLLGLIFVVGAVMIFVGLVMVLVNAINKERSRTGLKILLWGGLMLLGSFTLCSTMWKL